MVAVQNQPSYILTTNFIQFGKIDLIHLVFVNMLRKEYISLIMGLLKGATTTNGIC